MANHGALKERITLTLNQACGRNCLEWVRIVAGSAIEAGHGGVLKIFASPSTWEGCCILLGQEGRPYSIETVEHRGIIVTHMLGRVMQIHAVDTEYPYA